MIRRDKIVAIFVLSVSSLIIFMSIMQPHRIDRWQYGKWYVENAILQTGHIPTCGGIYQVDGLGQYWSSKICTRIYSPIPSLVTTISEMVTRFEFTNTKRRYMILTPLFKALVGYILIRMYSANKSFQIFGAGLFLIAPDYSYYYLTQTKGLSLPLLWLGLFALLKWKRSRDQRWSVIVLVLVSTLSLFYLPRAMILITSILVIAISITRKSSISVSLFLSSAIIFYVLQENLFVEQLSTFLPPILLNPSSLLSLSTTRTIPFAATGGSGIGYVLLPPFALIGLTGGLYYLYNYRSSFLIEDRILYSYAVITTYVIPSLSIGFFFTRIIFELIAPAILVGVAGVEKFGKQRVGLAVCFAVFLVVSGGLVIAFDQPDPYEDSYADLSSSLTSMGFSQDELVFTDFKTGAYLVGENIHPSTSKTTTGYNETTISSLWYDGTPSRACNLISKRYSSDYFILRSTVVSDFSIENHPRKAVPSIIVEKYQNSPDFNKVMSNGDFTMFELSCQV